MGISKLILKRVKNGRIRWQRHALERMMERDIFRNDVKDILSVGNIIKEYEDDQPFPSALFLGFIDEMPLQVVAAIDTDADWCYIVTAYRPDSDHFESDYKTRKK